MTREKAQKMGQQDPRKGGSDIFDIFNMFLKHFLNLGINIENRKGASGKSLMMVQNTPLKNSSQQMNLF